MAVGTRTNSMVRDGAGHAGGAKAGRWRLAAWRQSAFSCIASRFASRWLFLALLLSFATARDAESYTLYDTAQPSSSEEVGYLVGELQVPGCPAGDIVPKSAPPLEIQGEACAQPLTQLTYWVDVESLPEAPADDLRAGVREALGLWARINSRRYQLAAPITFVEASQAPVPLHDADDGVMVISWDKSGVVKKIGFGVALVCCDPVSGRIRSGSDIYLDGTRGPWVIDRKDPGRPPFPGCDGGSIYVQTVVAHEVGHVLGLGHADDISWTLRQALMASGCSQKQIDRQLRLERDDERGIAALYGSNQMPTIEAFEASATVVGVGEEVVLSLKVSDPEGDALRFKWTKDAGGYVGCTTSSGTCRWRAPQVAGTYRVSANVRDVKHKFFMHREQLITVSSAPEIVSVALRVLTVPGKAPMSVDFEVEVSGGSRKKAEFWLYCDRSDDGIDLRPGAAVHLTRVRGEPITLPGGCFYMAPGNYTAKVIAKRPGAEAGEARVVVNVMGCGDGVRQDPEQCDGNDDGTCPGQCQENCTCGSDCDGACPGTVVEVASAVGVDAPRPRVKVDADDSAIIVWQDKRSGTEEIYWTKVDRFGATLVAPQSLTAGTFAATLTDHGVDAAGNIYLAFQAGDDIRLAGAGADGARIWDGATVRLCTFCSNPSVVTAADGRTHIAYEKTNVTVYQVYYANVTFDGAGATWTTALVANSDIFGIVPKTPFIDLGSGGARYISWRDFDGSYVTGAWLARITGTNTVAAKWRIMQGDNVDKPVARESRFSPGSVWFLFENDTGAGRQIYGATGINEAALWSQGSGPATNPRVAVLARGAGDLVAAVWEDARSAVKRIYHTLGAGAEASLSLVGDEAIYPDVAAGTNDDFHVVWAQGPAGNRRIYWSRLTEQ